MADTIISQNIDLSSWDTLYSLVSTHTWIYDLTVFYNVCILESPQVYTMGYADRNSHISLHNTSMRL